ncbi:molybdopterin synthase [Haloferacaceae archaeon DSL9]
MQTLCVIGPGDVSVIERLLVYLSGRVATIERLENGEVEGAVSTGAYGLTPAGDWVATGSDESFDDLLELLAPRYDYLLVAGFSGRRLPTVVVGDPDETPRGEVIERVDSAADIDFEALAADLRQTEPYVTLETLVERAKASPQADRCGAIATFTGRVRAKDTDDDTPTTHLAFEKYDEVAEARMERISQELAARDGVFEVLMHHRVGVIEDGEDIVFVVVLAGHRTEAFRTVEDGINRLKDEVPIFKKETTVDEEFWVHDRA